MTTDRFVTKHAQNFWGKLKICLQQIQSRWFLNVLARVLNSSSCSRVTALETTSQSSSFFPCTVKSSRVPMIGFTIPMGISIILVATIIVIKPYYWSKIEFGYGVHLYLREVDRKLCLCTIRHSTNMSSSREVIHEHFCPLAKELEGCWFSIKATKNQVICKRLTAYYQIWLELEFASPLMEELFLIEYPSES